MILAILLSACIPILSVPATISAPGSYCLVSHLTHTASSGAAITVVSDFVTIDLQGNTLEGTAGSNTMAFGIATVNRKGLTVRNGTISGFLFGVRADIPSSAASIRDVTFLGNWYIGPWVHGGGAEVVSCRVLNTGGSTLPGYTRPLAIVARGSGVRVVGNTVASMTMQPGCIATGCEVVGLSIDDASGGLVRDNVFALASIEPNSYGIWQNGHNSTTTIQGNTFTGWGHSLVCAQGQGKYFYNVSQEVATPYLESPYSGCTDAGENR